MPNWNYTCVYLCSNDKDRLDDLRNELKNHLDRGYKYITEFMTSQGYDIDHINEVDGRDHIDYVDPMLAFDEDKKCYSFCLELDQAWGPRLGWLYQYVRDRYEENTIWIRWLGEESNSDIFVSNDFNADFFIDRFLARGETPKGECFYTFFETKQGLIEFINENFLTKFSDSTTISKIQNTINESSKTCDASIYINELELTNEYEELYFGGENNGNTVRNRQSAKSAA